MLGMIASSSQYLKFGLWYSYFKEFDYLNFHFLVHKRNFYIRCQSYLKNYKVLVNFGIFNYFIKTLSYIFAMVRVIMTFYIISF